MPGQLKASNTDSDLQLVRTPISPEDNSRKIVSTDWSVLRKCAGGNVREFSSPVHLVFRMLISVAMGVCWKTPMSPEDISRKIVSTDWFAFEEMCANFPHPCTW